MAASAPKCKCKGIEGTWKWLKNARRCIQFEFRNSELNLGEAQSLFDQARVDFGEKNIRKCEADLYWALHVHGMAEKKVRRLNEDGIVFRSNQSDFYLGAKERKWNESMERENPILTAGMPVTHRRASWASRGAASASASPGAAALIEDLLRRDAASGEGGEQAAASGEDAEPSAASQPSFAGLSFPLAREAEAQRLYANSLNAIESDDEIGIVTARYHAKYEKRQLRRANKYREKCVVGDAQVADEIPFDEKFGEALQPQEQQAPLITETPAGGAGPDIQNGDALHLAGLISSLDLKKWMQACDDSDDEISSSALSLGSPADEHFSSSSSEG